MAYERLEGPLGQRRDDVLAAMICERITSTLSEKAKVTVNDFLPDWELREEADVGNAQESVRPPPGQR